MKVRLALAITGATMGFAFACGTSDEPDNTPDLSDAGNDSGCGELGTVQNEFSTFDNAWKTYFEATSLLKCSGDEIDWRECGTFKTVTCGGTNFSETHVYDSTGALVGTEKSGIAEFRCTGTGAEAIERNGCTRRGYYLGSCTASLDARCAGATPACPSDFTAAWNAWKTSGSVGTASCGVLSSANCGSFSRIRCIVPSEAASWDAIDWYFDPTSGAPIAERALKVDANGRELTLPTCSAGPTWIPVPSADCTTIDTVTFAPPTDAGSDAN